MVRMIAVLAWSLVSFGMEAQSAVPPAAVATAYPRALAARDVAAVLPESVFFQGKSAPLQLRNAGGIELAKGRFLVVSLVDTSGYSSAVQGRYQAYLLTEEPVSIGGHRLTPGAYGCGFLADATFVVMDVGGHTLFTAMTEKEPGLKRPTPLQMRAAGAGFRLFAGRTFVTITIDAVAIKPDAEP